MLCSSELTGGASVTPSMRSQSHERRCHVDDHGEMSEMAHKNGPRSHSCMVSLDRRLPLRKKRMCGFDNPLSAISLRCETNVHSRKLSLDDRCVSCLTYNDQEPRTQLIQSKRARSCSR